MRKRSVLSVSLITLACAGSAHAIDRLQPTLAAPSPVLILVSGEAANQDAKKAQGFIQSIADRGIGLQANKELAEDKRKAQFRSLLRENFDMKTISRFALGRYWKTSTEAQRKEYQTLFETMIVEVYSRRFSDYDGQKLSVVTARPEGDTDAVVSSAIIPKQGPEIKVDWRVRNKAGKLQIVDIIVEGVSMSLTQRADFASVIQRGGGDIESLLVHLRGG